MPDDPWSEWREKIRASKNRSELTGDGERAGVETMLRIMEEQRRRAGIANPAPTNPSAMHQAAVESLTPERISNTAWDERTPATRMSSETAQMPNTTEFIPSGAGPAGQLSEAAALLLQTSGPAQVPVDRIHYCGTCKLRFPSKSKKKLHNKALAHVTYKCSQCMDGVFLSPCRLTVHRREVHGIESSPDDLLAGRVERTTQDAAPKVVPTGPWVPYFRRPVPYACALTTPSSPTFIESETSSAPTTNPPKAHATVTIPTGTARCVSVPSEVPTQPEDSVYRTETTVETPPCPSSNTVDASSVRGRTDQNAPEDSTVLPGNATAQTTLQILVYPRRHCGVCRHTFSTRKNKKLHNQVSTLLAYRCADCNENFETRCMFAVHQMDVHEIGYSRDGVLAVQAVTIVLPPWKKKYDHICSDCGCPHSTADALGYHEKTYHPNDHATSTAVDHGAAESRPKASGNLACSTCGLSLPSEKSKKRHYKVRLPGVHVCASCSEGFPTTCQLTVHCKQAHGSAGNLDHECSTCGLSFPSKGSKKRHSKARALIGRVYVCSSCSNGFTTQCELTVHCKQAHRGDSSGSRAPAIQATADQGVGPSVVSVQHMSSDVLPQLAYNSTHASTRDGVLGRSTQDAARQPFVQPLEDRQHGPAGGNVPISLPDPVQSPQEETPVNKYWRVCQNCGSFFSSSELLSTHQKQKCKKHDCPRRMRVSRAADAVYARLSPGSRPSAAVITVPTEYQCCDCRMSFFDSKGLESHFQSCKAVKRNLFECQSCSTRFQSQMTLAIHSRKCKKIPCLSTTFGVGSSLAPAPSNKKVCQKRFNTIQAMTAHLESGGCASNLDRHKINALIAKRDHEQTITLPAAASISSINAASFHAPPRALQTPAAVIDMFGDDSDSDVEVIFTPSTTAPGSPGGILTPASGYSIVPLDSKSCPACGAQFSTAKAAAQHVASPVHDLPRYRCPSDNFFTQLGLQVPSDGARHRKNFKTLAGLVGHVERGRCRGRDDGRKVVTELLRRLTGGDMIGLLGGGSA